MSRPGDWNCRSCSHLNFQRRDSCQRCGDPRSSGGRDFGGGFGGNDFGSFGGGDYGSFGGGAGGGSRSGGSLFGGVFSGPDVRPGDWYCNVGNCGAHNFASRSSCFKCGAFKEDTGSSYDGIDGGARSRGFGFGSGGSGAGGGSSRSGWKSGDWICTRSGCNEHNFASRTECFRCNAPRDNGNNANEIGNGRSNEEYST